VGDLFLLRHGQTAWAEAGRHTGLTDVPLTAYGEQEARAAGDTLRAILGPEPPALVLTSPLQRARRTAELAGLLEAQVEPDLVEWDYGGYEGRTTAEIRAAGHPGWLIFHDGVVAGATPGETLEQVAARGKRVLDRVRPALAEGDVVLVGHGHALRVLATDWLGRPPDLAQQLILSPASVSRLGSEHDVPAVRAWNVVPTEPPQPQPQEPPAVGTGG
jgi:probable phosphoglycerate mutase